MKVKRWLLASMLALAMVATWAGSALADDSIYHGGYTNTTARCAGCHRTHTGSGANLIKTATTYALCTSCHGSTNGLDVVDGTEWQTDPTTHAQVQPLTPLEAIKGGGFVKTLMNTKLDATKPATPRTATKTNPSSNTDPLIVPNSAHRINGMPILGGTVGTPTQATYSGTATVWGMGAINSGAGTAMTFSLECSTCHNPHGKSGPNREPTYRILRSDLNAKLTGASNSVYVPEDANTPHDFAVSSTTWVYYGETYNDPAPQPPPPGGTPTPAGTNVDLVKVSQWCAGCHTRVHATGQNAGSTNSGDTIYAFRHRSDGNAVTNNFGGSTVDGGGTPACLTCHVVHGSSATMSSSAASVPKPGAAEGSGAANYQDSALLRVDGRGVCELCHNK